MPVMASIQTKTGRTGEKQYVVRWRDPSGASKSKSFDRLQAARDYRADIETRLAKGTYVDPGGGKVTLREHAEHWLRLSRSSPGTKAKNRSLLNAQILPALGDVPVSKMNPLRVKEFLAAKSETLKPSTVRNLAEVLSSLSHSAVDHNLLATGWMPRRLDLPRDDADERVFLTQKQVLVLVNEAPPLYQALIYTAAQTGMRWGELAGLKASRVDLERGVIDVVQGLTYDGGKAAFSPPKTGKSRRAVGITDSTVAALREQIETYGLGEHDTVFHGPQGGLLRDDNFRKRVWQPLLASCTPERVKKGEIAEAVPPQTHFHDLRHTHVAFLIDAGWDLKSISDRLGHSSVAITGDRYGHLFAAVQQRNLGALEAQSQAARD